MIALKSYQNMAYHYPIDDYTIITLHIYTYCNKQLPLSHRVINIEY